MGLYRAGFDVVGVDIHPQPRYPAFHHADYASHFEFVQADALTFDLSGFDAVWASPPCQYAVRGLAAINAMQKRATKPHPNLIPQTRALIERHDLPYIIENIPSAKELQRHVQLCGTMFGLKVFRHRNFESNHLILGHHHAKHNGHTSSPSLAAYHTFDKGDYITVVGHLFRLKDAQVAMEIGWMTRDEIKEAIPPAYSEFLGRQLIRYVENDVCERVSPG